MIDLHSHILPDLDDGAATLAEALALGRMAAADGIRTIAATPHSPASIASRHYSPALIQEQVAALNTALAAEAIDLTVIAGTEICYDGSIVELLRAGTLLPYGTSRAVLLELPHDMLPPAIDQALFALQLAGYRVVLAHPERIAAVQRDPNVLLPLIERGALVQLTAEALTGQQGQRLRTAAETLLTHGMAHVLASDAHGLPPRRPPLLSAARDRAIALLGPAAAALVTTIPAAILQDAPLRLDAPRPVARARWRLWR
ncbi:MAG TPA: CpsB/CapC family capsule biosynthesis tyrosine phosphatase [Roseiflexaceae bacterium]|nr:CpsB/CapC family capsule biosynthesis tyrosine phosphatase [Roseiflexaceae bacterium]